MTCAEQNNGWEESHVTGTAGDGTVSVAVLVFVGSSNMSFQ